MKTYMFLDLETTGTDPVEDRILEVAWTFTDEHFKVIGAPRSFRVDAADDWSQVIQRLKQTPYVLNMHVESGLWAELAGENTTPAYKVRDQMYDDIAKQSTIGADIHLAGFSVHFDKSFLEHWSALWSLDGSGLHHRIYDLSAVKMALENVGIPYQKATNHGAHRALNDIFEAIDQARIFREQLSHLPVV